MIVLFSNCCRVLGRIQKRNLRRRWIRANTMNPKQQKILTHGITLFVGKLWPCVWSLVLFHVQLPGAISRCLVFHSSRDEAIRGKPLFNRKWYISWIYPPASNSHHKISYYYTFSSKFLQTFICNWHSGWGGRPNIFPSRFPTCIWPHHFLFLRKKSPAGGVKLPAVELVGSMASPTNNDTKLGLNLMKHRLNICCFCF